MKRHMLTFVELLCAFAFIVCTAGTLHLGWSEVPAGIFAVLLMISDEMRDMECKKAEHSIAHY